jgi:hypothetical protein
VARARFSAAGRAGSSSRRFPHPHHGPLDADRIKARSDRRTLSSFRAPDGHDALAKTRDERGQGTGEHHGVRGLFVLDGSLFPTSIGVPPQISIYAMAKHLAKHAIERAM